MGNIYTKKYNAIKQKETNAYQPPTDLVFTHLLNCYKML